MPAVVDVPAPPDQHTAPPTTLRPDHTAEADASDDLGPRRAGRGGRQLLIAGVIGAIIGAAIPGGIQLAERAAADGDADSLRTVAMDYLTAIAEGRAADATAIVPLSSSATVASDAVLQSAERITEPEVRLVHIDGDAATVEVGFQVVRSDIAHDLDAERVDGEWRISTSLAEPLQLFEYGARFPLQIAGEDVRATGDLTNTSLYPGRYEFDTGTNQVFSTSAPPITVDGDPRTPIDAYMQPELEPEIARYATDLGLRLALECQAAQSCAIPADVELRATDQAYMRNIVGDSVDIGVPVMLGSNSGGEWYDVSLRLILDETGAPSEWLCAEPASAQSPTDPCPAPE